MKLCKTCCGEKPFTEFSKHRETADGHRPECKACRSERERQRRLADPETLRAKDRERSKAERPRRNATALKWARNNPDKAKASKAAWFRNNPHMRAAYVAKRRAHLLNATPPWVDYEKVDAIYAEASAMRELGIDVHVDHIVPLLGGTVTGLHWHGNLRLMLASENITKGNRVWPDMP